MQRCTVRSIDALLDSVVVCFCVLIRGMRAALGRVNKLEKKEVMMGVEAILWHAIETKGDLFFRF